MIDKQRLRTFLLGGAIGALAGVLLAPRSGRELRSNITNRAEEARERGRETYFETSERLQERLAETREGPFKSPEPESETSVSPGLSPEEPTTFTERPKLREVSSEGYKEEHSDAKPDELRRKVQETRARLRERLEGPEQGGTKEDPDE
ncbi:hypothetical protein BH24ACT21_BH24ACT21_00330 [soil metagenome]|jgi:hypothetical protein